jgi:hypothetical protein
MPDDLTREDDRGIPLPLVLPSDDVNTKYGAEVHFARIALIANGIRLKHRQDGSFCGLARINIKIWLRQVTGWSAETVLRQFRDQERRLLLNPIRVLDQPWPPLGYKRDPRRCRIEWPVPNDNWRGRIYLSYPPDCLPDSYLPLFARDFAPPGTPYPTITLASPEYKWWFINHKTRPKRVKEVYEFLIGNLDMWGKPPPGKPPMEYGDHHPGMYIKNSEPDDLPWFMRY